MVASDVGAGYSAQSLAFQVFHPYISRLTVLYFAIAVPDFVGIGEDHSYHTSVNIVPELCHDPAFGVLKS